MKQTTWICPNCGRRVTIHVKTSHPPTCANPLKHSTRIIEMQPHGGTK